MERKGFFCYNSWLKALEPFGDAERGRIWTALLEYSNGLAIDGHSSGNERFILPMLLDQIDRDTQKNEKKSQTLKERQSQSTPSNPAQPTTTRSNPPKDKDKNKDKDIPTTAAACAQGEQYNADFADCIQRYEQNCGSVPRAVADAISTALLKFPASLICQAIDEAAANNARRWSYISKILDRCEQQGICTVEAYLAEKESAKSSRTAARQTDTTAAMERLKQLAKGVTADD
jgi:DnaD/phage-associated family protein|uniref:Replication initiation and membrane attachment n=1 Tax=Ackermannviridae sp. TaxID=2831612 RepID=A0A8S5VPJ9_9CAUD|nr:MAG TPA: Replication initiation and membrane attachment [Ackermannviridae sp.]